MFGKINEPVPFDSSTVGGGETIYAIGGVGNAEDIVFTLKENKDFRTNPSEVVILTSFNPVLE